MSCFFVSVVSFEVDAEFCDKGVVIGVDSGLNVAVKVFCVISSSVGRYDVANYVESSLRVWWLCINLFIYFICD